MPLYDQDSSSLVLLRTGQLLMRSWTVTLSLSLIFILSFITYLTINYSTTNSLHSIEHQTSERHEYWSIPITRTFFLSPNQGTYLHHKNTAKTLSQTVLLATSTSPPHYNSHHHNSNNKTGGTSVLVVTDEVWSCVIITLQLIQRYQAFLYFFFRFLAAVGIINNFGNSAGVWRLSEGLESWWEGRGDVMGIYRSRMKAGHTTLSCCCKLCLLTCPSQVQDGKEYGILCVYVCV